MNLFRLLLGLGGAGVLATALSSCLAEPNYSSTPEISFDNAQVTRLSDKRGVRDTLVLTIRYQDGDGDLGLTSDEVSNKAGKYVGTKYINNFFVVPYVKDAASGNFVALASTSRAAPLFITRESYYSRFDHITSTTDSRSLPIKGTLVWSYSFVPTRPFAAGEQVKFEITIADRALHESNTILTDAITFPK